MKRKSLSKITLGRWPIFTHLLVRFTSQMMLDMAQLQGKQPSWPAIQWLFMSIQQELYMHCELVRLPAPLLPHCRPHTSVWCGAHSSSHNHPPATNKHGGGGGASCRRLFHSSISVRTRNRRRRPQMLDLPLTPVWFYTVIFTYWSHEGLLRDPRGLETVTICYSLS